MGLVGGVGRGSPGRYGGIGRARGLRGRGRGQRYRWAWTVRRQASGSATQGVVARSLAARSRRGSGHLGPGESHNPRPPSRRTVVDVW